MGKRTFSHGGKRKASGRKKGIVNKSWWGSNDSLTAEAFVSSMSEELRTKCFASMNYYKIIVQSCGTRGQTNEAKRRKLAELLEENKHRRI